MSLTTMGTTAARLILILGVAFLMGGCTGKHKAFCLDMHEGSNAHIQVGYLYDTTSMTVTGPMRISTTPDGMTVDPCAHVGTP